MSSERRSPKGLLAALILASASISCSDGADSGPPPAQNVILISIDTLRADHLSSYGYERKTSPKLDFFAERGTLFENALSTASWTVPAHMTMLTGVDAATHGLLAYPEPGRLAPEATTLAERLQGEGFHTAAFTGGGFVSRQHGFEQGFDVFEHRLGKKFRYTVPHALGWINTIPEDERFFLFLHGFDVHGPYIPAKNLDRFFCPEYEGNYNVKDFKPAGPVPSEEDMNYVLAQYDACIRSADRILWKFLKSLEDAGRLENTLVVITSDHGEEMYEHGSIEHTHSLYEECVRIPLIFVGPNVPPGRVEQQVGLIDIYPTVLDLAGVDAGSQFQGRNVLENSTPAPVFGYVDTSFYPYRLKSVRTDRWKLVKWELSGMKGVERNPDHRYSPRFKTRAENWVELFDLDADPGEKNDVAADHPDVVERLLELMRDQVEVAAQYSASPIEAAPADEQYLKDLEALGYGK